MSFLWFWFANLPLIKTWKKPEIKNVLSPTTTKRTASGESNLIGTRTEETLTVTKKSPAVDEECDFCFVNYYTAKYMKKGT